MLPRLISPAQNLNSSSRIHFNQFKRSHFKLILLLTLLFKSLLFKTNLNSSYNLLLDIFLIIMMQWGFCKYVFSKKMKTNIFNKSGQNPLSAKDKSYLSLGPVAYIKNVSVLITTKLVFTKNFIFPPHTKNVNFLNIYKLNWGGDILRKSMSTTPFGFFLGNSSSKPDQVAEAGRLERKSKSSLHFTKTKEKTT